MALRTVAGLFVVVGVVFVAIGFATVAIGGTLWGVTSVICACCGGFIAAVGLFAIDVDRGDG